MSTQTTFDVDGLRRAVAARDEDYLLALYADRAEVEFIDPDHPEAPLQVLRGKPAIQEWLHDMSSPDVRYQVWNSAAGRESLRFTEECSYPDGTHLRYECRAEVRSGQITRARVAVVCPSAVKPAGDAGDQPAHPVDEDPPRTPPPPASSVLTAGHVPAEHPGQLLRVNPPPPRLSLPDAGAQGGVRRPAPARPQRRPTSVVRRGRRPQLVG